MAVYGGERAGAHAIALANVWGAQPDTGHAGQARRLLQLPESAAFARVVGHAERRCGLHWALLSPRSIVCPCLGGDRECQ